MIDPELRAEFETWYAAQIADDPEFELAGTTALQFLSWAEAHSRLDRVLGLPSSGVSLREWWSINMVPVNPANPFPDVRRKGGDQDRGFSPALNQEMRNRIPK